MELWKSAFEGSDFALSPRNGNEVIWIHNADQILPSKFVAENWYVFIQSAV